MEETIIVGRKMIEQQVRLVAIFFMDPVVVMVSQ
jgi:hypothetical protein